MGGPGEEFSTGQGGHRLYKGANNLSSALKDQWARGHIPTQTLMATCVPRSTEPRIYQSLREGGLRLSRLVYFMLKCSHLWDFSSDFYHSLPLLQYPIPCSSPGIPLIPAPHPELLAYVLPQGPLATPTPPIGCMSDWVSYLRIEADLTDITGNDGPLGFEQGSPKGVGKHSLLYRVHLWRQAGVSQEFQHKPMSIIPSVVAAGLNQSPRTSSLSLSVPESFEPQSFRIPSQPNLYGTRKDLRDRQAQCSHLTESRSGLPKVTP